MTQKTWSPETVHIRPFVSDDAEVLTAALNDLTVSQWLARVPHPYTKHDALEFLSGNDDDAKAVTVDGELVGGVAVNDEFGYWFKPKVWGQGLASHVAQRVVGDFLRQKPSATLKSGYFIGNDASARVLQKTGFREVSCGLIYCNALGEARRHVSLELTRADWEMRS